MFANNLTKLLQPKVRVMFNKGFPALLNSICMILMSKLFIFTEYQHCVELPCLSNDDTNSLLYQVQS